MGFSLSSKSKFGTAEPFYISVDRDVWEKHSNDANIMIKNLDECDDCKVWPSKWCVLKDMIKTVKK